MAQAWGKRPREYEDWQEMAQKEKLEVVLIATPLWTHADITVGFLNAGVHVFCEKMMAYDVAGCERMIAAARRNHRLLEIGYVRFYVPVYQAAYKNII
jgi:predicted dehydrogenase